MTTWVKLLWSTFTQVQFLAHLPTSGSGRLLVQIPLSGKVFFYPDVTTHRGRSWGNSSVDYCRKADWLQTKRPLNPRWRGHFDKTADHVHSTPWWTDVLRTTVYKSVGHNSHSVWLTTLLFRTFLCPCSHTVLQRWISLNCQKYNVCGWIFSEKYSMR